MWYSIKHKFILVEQLALGSFVPPSSMFRLWKQVQQEVHYDSTGLLSDK
jgi:hypothetical protein